MLRVEIKPDLLLWAVERSGREVSELVGAFPRLPLWLDGEALPTLKQLEAFAKRVHVPIGYLFLDAPPEEKLPIPDMRTMGNRFAGTLTPDLLDVVHLCQGRQAWYRDHLQSLRAPELSFVQSVTLEEPVADVAMRIRDLLGFDLDHRRKCPTWTDALRSFIRQAEDLGILVMISGVVGSNTRRKLDPREFRGFALADSFAPLVFINGADTKAAQMFTLAHEIAHIFLGESALSDATAYTAPGHQIEKWCNEIAAELLVPLEVLKQVLPGGDPLDARQELATRFKVSTLVILRRLLDAGAIRRDTYHEAYEEELQRLLALQERQSVGGGGDFYLTKEASSSRNFVKALVASTLEGYTQYTEAFRLLGIRKMETFNKMGSRLELIL